MGFPLWKSNIENLLSFEYAHFTSVKVASLFSGICIVFFPDKKEQFLSICISGCRKKGPRYTYVHRYNSFAWLGLSNASSVNANKRYLSWYNAQKTSAWRQSLFKVTWAYQWRHLHADRGSPILEKPKIVEA